MKFTGKNLEVVYKEGYRAASQVGLKVNPYPEKSSEAVTWDDGYVSAVKDGRSY